MQKPIAIIGVGNLLMGDEGVGIHAISHLCKFNWPDEVELIDAGVPGPSLLYMIEDRKLSVIIDCADFKGKPGEIMVVDVERLKKPGDEIISLHDTSLLGTIALAEKMGSKTGKIILICIQPKDIIMSENLSKEVADSISRIREKILDQLGRN